MQARPDTLAIIPARGASKGIPKKNIFPLLGSPLITYTIKEARKAACVTRVVVSTDCQEIAAVSRECGAEIVWRPPELSGDTASSESALLHCLDFLRETEGYNPELIVFLQATSPLRKSEQIDAAVERLKAQNADSLFSAHSLRGFLWRVEDGSPAPFNYDYRSRPRRQDRVAELVENGAIYVLKTWVLRELKCRLGGRIAVYEMPALDSFEIDEPVDLPLIEAILEHRGRENTGR